MKRKIKCPDCDRRFPSNDARRQHQHAKHNSGALADPDTEPDWSGECEVCGQSPIVPVTGLCGPCTFGEAETIGGNW